MGFSFIHTADWQIGKPFRNFPERVAGRLEGARLNVIDTLAEAARQRGIRHVLVAGDIWDGERLPAAIERQPLARMARHSEVRWALLPGNHDAARVGSVWTRLVARGLPENVRPLVEPGPVVLAPGASVLPSPLRTRSPASDPTQWMDGAETPPGTLRIGLAHGPVQGFGSDSDAVAVIDAGRFRKAGLDYLALGDWHGTTRINARTWYSGTPEPDGFKDNDPGNALAVTIEGPGAEPKVERIATGHFIWTEIAAEIGGVDDLERLEREIRGRGRALERMLVRLELRGALPAGVLYRIEAWSEALEAELQHLSCDASPVGVASGGIEPEIFGASGQLRRAAELLAGMAADKTNPAAADAAAAVKRLVAALADVREGGR